MSIQANVQLNLPKESNRIVLEYNTYEPATFDQYLAACIIKNVPSNKVKEYIDSIAGKGSLNKHFNDLIIELAKLDINSISNLLESSMYPITKIDKSNRYIFYPSFGVSILNNKIYGDFSKCSVDELKEKLMLSYDIINSTIEKNGSNDDNYSNYTVRFTDNLVEISICDKWFELKEESFIQYRKPQKLDMKKYSGKIHNNVEGEGWNILFESYFNNLYTSEKTFLDENGDYCILTNDYIKKTQITKMHELYFYKEYRIDFNMNNSKYCEQALEELMKKPIFNEIKTKTLVALLNNSNELLKRTVMDFVLSRKQSNEIASLSLNLIKSGVKDDWSVATLEQIKKICTTSDLQYLYGLNSKLKFEPFEIALIDDCYLSSKDLKLKNNYLNDRRKKIEAIQNKLGIITDSGLRENIKKLKSTEQIKKFSKMCNKLIGHKNQSSEELGDNQLNSLFNQVNEFYDLYLNLNDEYKREIEN